MYSFLPFFNTYSMYTNGELTGFLIGSIITLILAGIILLTHHRLGKCRIKNLRVGQYYWRYDDCNSPDIVKLVEMGEGLLTYLTKDQEVVVTSPETFIERFEKLSEHGIEKYSRLLPDK